MVRSTIQKQTGHVSSIALATLSPSIQDSLFFWSYIAFLTACWFATQPIAQILFLIVLGGFLLTETQRWASNQPHTCSLVIVPVHHSRLLWAAALLLASLSFSEVNFRELTVSLEILGFLVLTAVIVASQEDLGPFFMMLCAITALHAALAMIQFIPTVLDLVTVDALPAYRLGTRSATIMGTLYAIFLVAAFATLIRPALVWRRIVLAASGSILLLAVLLTQSRGAYLAVFGGLAVALSCASRKMRMATTAMAVVISVLLLSTPGVITALLIRGDSYRLETWHHYLQVAAEQPLLGHGRKRLYFNASDGFFIPHPHNLVLSAQVRGGVLGAAAMIAMLFGGLYYAYRYAKLTGNAAPLGIIVTLILAGLLDYDVLARQHANWGTLLFWLPMGICIGAELRVRSKRTRSEVGSSI